MPPLTSAAMVPWLIRGVSVPPLSEPIVPLLP